MKAADETRRRIERDLHDGAQQRLLAVTFELRLARSASTDERRNAVLDAAIAQATAALADLRDIAHGIFPAVLDESGAGGRGLDIDRSRRGAGRGDLLPDERCRPRPNAPPT